MNYKSELCSCIKCHQIKSVKGIFSHYITAHTDEGNAKASERGKIGGDNSKDYSTKLRNNNIADYLKNPSRCKECNINISYDNKHNVFCSKSCSAKYNNTLRGSKKDNNSLINTKENKKLTYNCLQCGVERLYNHRTFNKYCSQTCQHLHKRNQRIESGTASSKTLKRYLIDTRGYKCWECGITEWKNKPIGLELEHIDGNSDNNELDNLSLLCPNCHSQTSTYKAKNKGNGRHSRRQRYREGKSF